MPSGRQDRAAGAGTWGGRRGLLLHSRPVFTLTSEYINANFCLLGDSDNARVCRRLRSGGRVCVRPVVALEDLEGVLDEHHNCRHRPAGRSWR